MANKKVSDKDYLFISSMLKARENRMLRRDRLEQMLSSGSFEEAARLLAEIGWPDLSGKGSAAVSEALAKRQAEIYAEITRFVPEKELVGIFRLKYDYHNAKTIVKGEGALKACKVIRVCPKCCKTTRPAHKFDADGKKLTVCKKCGAEI